MLNRRTLFARLSAVALAPLAKWLPKEEVNLPSLMYHPGGEFEFLNGQYVVGCDIASGPPSFAILRHSGSSNPNDWTWELLPVPQEEA